MTTGNQFVERSKTLTQVKKPMHMIKTNKLGAAGKALLTGVAMAVVASACSTTPRHENSAEYYEWAFTQARLVDLPSSVFAALEDGRQGDVIAIGDTQWGSNSELQVSERYFAASGRPCLRGRVVGSNRANSEQVVVCRYSAERWVISRAVAETFDNPNTIEGSE